MSEYSEFFLAGRSDIVQLDLVELTHPYYSEEYRFVRNAPDGVTVNLSDSEQAVEFVYVPAKITALGARDDLDAAIKIDLGDVGEIVAAETERVAASGSFNIKPRVRYWTFRSDRLDSPIYGPLELEVPSFSFNSTGVSFEARAPALNVTRTGERYKMDRFVTLQGYL